MIPDLESQKRVSMLIFVIFPSPEEISMTYFSILNTHRGYRLNKHFHIFEGMHVGEVNPLPGSHIGRAK